jgi:hypothetical protein
MRYHRIPTTRYHHLLAARFIFFIFFITFFPVKKIKKIERAAGGVRWWDEDSGPTARRNRFHHIYWQERSAVARRTEQQP